MPSVEQVRWARFRVTTTVLVGLTILSTLVVLLTGGTLFEAQSDLYLFLPDATGLAPGSPVRVDGIQVGKVDLVALSGSSEANRVVKVTMIVERGRLASITEDSTAQSSSDTLVGDKFIQITTGSSPQRAQPGMEVRFKASTDFTKGVDLTQFRKQLEVMDGLLTEIEGGTSPLGQFVIGEQMYREVRKRIVELEHTFRTAASSTSATGHEIYTDVLYLQIREPFVKLDQMLAKLQSGQGSGGRLFRDDSQYQQVRDQVTALRKSIAEARSAEMMRSDVLYGELNQKVDGWMRAVDTFNVNPMLGTTAVYDNLTGMAKELQGTAKEFRENPKKFLRLKVF